MITSSLYNQIVIIMAAAIAAPVQTSLEAQVFETVKALAEAEKNLATPLEQTSIALDLEGNTATLTVILPITIANVGGDMTITAVPYAI